MVVIRDAIAKPPEEISWRGTYSNSCSGIWSVAAMKLR
jgi:hypothetical protein